ncbi:hypothetical protein [Streptomyces sp. NBC_01565]|uniref:hypothetical protein n=1 Tax=Streptomyces sp. NBC_01565 TaxID=2975881 RepID=UPI002258AE83|nr:hypothetical protein [Streptomyces sp. NBC_01565]MCX4543822.1 hypothetical protein [Streptomyces sp. NBC_01565]
MTTATLLTLSKNTTPVEKAVVSGIADGFDPETFLWINFHRPNGGIRIWYAWTAGGAELGHKIDGIALNLCLDGADWLHYGDRNAVHSTRGAIEIQAYPLRPILADIQNGEGAPEERRAALIRFVDAYAAEVGATPKPGRSTWLGYGPQRVNGGHR